MDLSRFVGDPNPWAWAVVAAYLASSSACLLAGVRRRRLANGDAQYRWFWFALAATLLFLAFNKQADLQSDLERWAARTAVRNDWYDNRRVLQAWFIVGLAAAGLAFLAVIFFAFRRAPLGYWVTNVGLAFLVGFVVIRASSFYYVDVLLRLNIADGRAVNFALELGGSALIAFGASLLFVRSAASRRGT